MPVDGAESRAGCDSRSAPGGRQLTGPIHSMPRMPSISLMRRRPDGRQFGQRNQSGQDVLIGPAMGKGHLYRARGFIYGLGMVQGRLHLCLEVNSKELDLSWRFACEPLSAALGKHNCLFQKLEATGSPDDAHPSTYTCPVAMAARVGGADSRRCRPPRSNTTSHFGAKSRFKAFPPAKTRLYARLQREHIP